MAKEKALSRVEFPIVCPSCNSKSHLVRRKELLGEGQHRRPAKKRGTHWKQEQATPTFNDVEYRVSCLDGHTLSLTYTDLHFSIIEALVNVVTAHTPKIQPEKARQIAENYAKVTVEKME